MNSALTVWLVHRTGGTLHVWLTPSGWQRELRAEIPAT